MIIIILLFKIVKIIVINNYLFIFKAQFCCEEFSPADRVRNFNMYWCAPKAQKWYYFFRTTKQVATNHLTRRAKDFTYHYYMFIDGHLKRVCKVFYRDTLNIAMDRLYKT